jgi:hypothetical protein
VPDGFPVRSRVAALLLNPREAGGLAALARLAADAGGALGPPMYVRNSARAAFTAADPAGQLACRREVLSGGTVAAFVESRSARSVAVGGR